MICGITVMVSNNLCELWQAGLYAPIPLFHQVTKEEQTYFDFFANGRP
jgi:hypothetical protein